MCRALHEGGRRCRGADSRPAQNARQRRCRARKALVAAQATGDPNAINQAQQRFDALLATKDGNVAPTSGDPVAAAQSLADAFQRGHTVEHVFSEGQNSQTVQKVRLADGSEAVYKEVDLAISENPDEIQDAYLAGLVADALGIEHTTAAIVGENQILTELAPGVTGAEQRVAAGDIDPAGARVRTDELNRVLHMRNAREIALLDYVTGNLDRNDNNYLVDGDTVYPIDHAFAYFDAGRSNDTGDVLNSPFSQQHLHTKHEVHDNDPVPPRVPRSELTSPFNATEMAQFRTRLETLKPAFDAQGATPKWDFMMRRLTTIEHATD